MHRPASRTLAKARKWIKSQSGTVRNFLWVHLFDPHYPYLYRAQHLKRLTPSGREAKFKRWIEFIRDERHFSLFPSNAFKNFLQNERYTAYSSYDSEIRYTDYALKKLVRAVEKYLDSEPMIAIVGDHGEGLGNHGWWGHGREIYNEQIRIPFVLSFPGERYGRKTYDTVVETNDLMPTILKMVDVPEEVLRGRTFPVEGTPLQELLRGDSSDFGYAFSQRRYYESLNWIDYLDFLYSSFRYNPVHYPFSRPYQYEPGRKFSLVGPRYKYIYGTRKEDQVFDLTKDFSEQSNLLSSPPRTAVQLGGTLKNLVDYMRKNFGRKTVEVDEETQKMLDNLGYIN